jgi:hypothetical protein
VLSWNFKKRPHALPKIKKSWGFFGDGNRIVLGEGADSVKKYDKILVRLAFCTRRTPGISFFEPDIMQLIYVLKGLLQ